MIIVTLAMSSLTQSWSLCLFFIVSPWYGSLRLLLFELVIIKISFEYISLWRLLLKIFLILLSTFSSRLRTWPSYSLLIILSFTRPINRRWLFFLIILPTIRPLNTIIWRFIYILSGEHSWPTTTLRLLLFFSFKRLLLNSSVSSFNRSIESIVYVELIFSLISSIIVLIWT